MNLAAEFAAGFSEGAKPLATAYTLTNEEHRGVITDDGGEVAIREPGLERIEAIIIVEPVANFTRPPDPEKLEIVQVLEGQFAGKWVLTQCHADNAHYTMRCEASE